MTEEREERDGSSDDGTAASDRASSPAAGFVWGLTPDASAPDPAVHSARQPWWKRAAPAAGAEEATPLSSPPKDDLPSDDSPAHEAVAAQPFVEKPFAQETPTAELSIAESAEPEPEQFDWPPIESLPTQPFSFETEFEPDSESESENHPSGLDPSEPAPIFGTLGTFEPVDRPSQPAPIFGTLGSFEPVDPPSQSETADAAFGSSGAPTSSGFGNAAANSATPTAAVLHSGVVPRIPAGEAGFTGIGGSGGSGPGGAGGSGAAGGAGGRHNPKLLWWVAGGLVLLVVVVAVFFFGSKFGAQPPAASSSPGASPVVTAAASPGVHAWDALFGGECLNPYTSPWQNEFTVVDCASPHAAQLVYRGSFGGDAAAAFPGEQALGSQINALCTQNGIVDPSAAAQHSGLQVQGAYPVTAEQWQSGQRYYYCFVSSSDGKQITGSLQGAGPQ